MKSEERVIAKIEELKFQSSGAGETRRTNDEYKIWNRREVGKTTTPATYFVKAEKPMTIVFFDLFVRVVFLLIHKVPLDEGTRQTNRNISGSCP